MGSVADVGLIAAVIVANASLGAAQEAQVARAAAALDRVTAATARVLRDGNHVSVPAQEVVPGDVLLLAHGDRVAADARLIAATGLEVNEAALSGESAHVAKHPDGPAAASRIVLAGTDVTVGHGRAVVFAVGPETRLGATAAALHVEPVEVGPLGVRLNRMVSQVLPVTGAAGLAILLSGLAWRRPLLTQLTLAASAAIAAVPEGLPLLAGIGQAAVARRLAARHALVRRLSAVEALGRVDVACVDKTGTLTEGRLSVERVLGPFEGVSRPDGLAPEHEDVLRAAAIASPGTGSSAAAAHATDVAVHRAMAAAGLADRHAEARLAEAPFDQSRPYHATLVESRLCAKGSTEALAGRCTHVRDQGAVRPLDDDGRRRLRERADELAALGLRVLIVAEGPPSTPPWDPRSLVALGFLAIRDAVRPGAVDAVRRCREAGVRMIMLTGDHPETARAIGLDVGLVDTAGSVLTGDEMADLTDTDLDARLADVAIIARISPLEKLRVVESLQRQGHTVAMTGDGVNDAPALRLADVGVAMGRDGTEVARQAAEIVLADDDVSTLVEGLIGGRAFWSNTRRALAMLLGGNLGEIAFITAIAVLGLPASLTTRQVLAVNLGSDVLPAISLAVQEPRSGDLGALSREGTAAVGRPLWGEIARRGIATAVPALLAYLLTLRAQGPRQAQTVGFVSIVATQLAQTLDTGITEGGRVRPVVLAVGGSAALLGATVLVPRARAFLGLATPTPLGVAAIVLASALAIVMNRAAQASLPRKAGTAAVPA
jgi:calcium-translocating P-type ATPase